MKPLSHLLPRLALAAVVFSTAAKAGPEQDLADALSELEGHLRNDPVLSPADIATRKATIDANVPLFGTSAPVIGSAFDLVETYDTEIGPLWVAGSPVQEFDRTNVADDDIHWVVYNVMQHVMDETYTRLDVTANQTLLDGFTFGCSAHFPGHVDPPAVVETHTATVDASYPDTFGWLRQNDDLPARKPTGSYAAPGSVVTVTVPASLVDKGYQVRVGAHRWDLETSDAGSPRRWVRRLDRATILFDVDSTEIKVASPLGGGIYLEVPYEADAGVVDIDITGAVRSPYFSAKSFHTTSLSDWLNVERHHPAPWADFQTEKFMMQVPTGWISSLDNPDTLMADWDLAIDRMNDLMGFPRDRGKETMYLQVDVISRGGAYFPGYPTSNITYDPNTDYGGLADNHLTKGPRFAPSHVFHEQGHAYLFKKFSGEVESHVNLHHVAVWNQAFGFDLDTAFACGQPGPDPGQHRRGMDDLVQLRQRVTDDPA